MTFRRLNTCGSETYGATAYSNGRDQYKLKISYPANTDLPKSTTIEYRDDKPDYTYDNIDSAVNTFVRARLPARSAAAPCACLSSCRG